jgi:hypothetical protein
MKKVYAFLLESVTDITRRVDGKLLTIAAVATMVVLCFPIGWIFNRWPPEYIWISTLAFLAAALGIDAHLTSKALEAQKPPGTTVEIDNAEEVNLKEQSL